MATPINKLVMLLAMENEPDKELSEYPSQYFSLCMESFLINNNPTEDKSSINPANESGKAVLL